MRLIPMVLFAAWLGAGATSAQTPDLSGMWLAQDPGSGSFTEWYNNVPKPQLRPEIIEDNEANAQREAEGEVVNRAPTPGELPRRQPSDDDGLFPSAQHRPVA